MSSFATFRNIIKVFKIGTLQRNMCTIFLKVLNTYFFSKIFQKVEIVMLRWNILQCLTKMLRQYSNCNEIYEIFLTSFCNILCYVSSNYLNVTNNYWIAVFCVYRCIKNSIPYGSLITDRICCTVVLLNNYSCKLELLQLERNTWK